MAVQQLVSGVFAEIFAKVAARSEEVVDVGLHLAGTAVRDEVKASFVGQHAHGTPTPARRGGPPSRISRSLDESIIATLPSKTATGWSTKIGAESGHHPSYGRGTVDSATYGLYLETGRAGRQHLSFPFLVPAFHRVVDEAHLVGWFRHVPWI